jgi:hypothetical protein
MLGCVELFERIDPHCQRIDTFVGDERDTVYMRTPGKGWGWEAFDGSMKSAGELQQ